jgi:hypothetical protein
VFGMQFHICVKSETGKRVCHWVLQESFVDRPLYCGDGCLEVVDLIDLDFVGEV